MTRIILKLRGSFSLVSQGFADVWILALRQRQSLRNGLPASTVDDCKTRSIPSLKAGEVFVGDFTVRQKGVVGQSRKSISMNKEKERPKPEII